MSDTYQPQQQIYPPAQPEVQPPVEPGMPPVTTPAPDTPIGTAPPEGTPFATAFPNADEASVQKAEQEAADAPDTTGVVVNPGPQLSMNAPDQSEPAMPPPPVTP